jgi:hypothetical protein
MCINNGGEMTDRKRALDMLQKSTHNKFAPSVEDQISAMLAFASECVKEAVLEEREACAKVCLEHKHIMASGSDLLERCAKAILEREK